MTIWRLSLTKKPAECRPICNDGNSRAPYSVVALPLNVFVVPGMCAPPSCHSQTLLLFAHRRLYADPCRRTRTGGPTSPVIPSIRIYASRWRIYRLPHRLEPQDNPGREPKVILRSACELGHEVVRLNQAPMNPVDHLRIDAASECQREGRMSNSSRAVMCSADEQVTKWRYFVGRH